MGYPGTAQFGNPKRARKWNFYSNWRVAEAVGQGFPARTVDFRGRIKAAGRKEGKQIH